MAAIHRRHRARPIRPRNSAGDSAAGMTASGPLLWRNSRPNRSSRRYSAAVRGGRPDFGDVRRRRCSGHDGGLPTSPVPCAGQGTDRDLLHRLRPRRLPVDRACTRRRSAQPVRRGAPRRSAAHSASPRCAKPAARGRWRALARPRGGTGPRPVHAIGRRSRPRIASWYTPVRADARTATAVRRWRSGLCYSGDARGLIGAGRVSSGSGSGSGSRPARRAPQRCASRPGAPGCAWCAPPSAWAR
jgi:hypothetical protein